MNRIGRLFITACVLAVLFAPLPAFGGEEGDVLVVPIHGPIDLGRLNLVRKAVDRALTDKFSAMVLEMDTPGGRLDYTEEILRHLDRARQGGITTLAYCRGNAWSAGAIICTGCDKIYMRKASALGAAQPIYIEGSSIKEASEKVVSAMRAMSRGYAQKTGRPPALVEAMVDPDLEVLEVETPSGVVYLDRRNYENEASRADREGYEIQRLSTVIEKGKLLSLSAEDALRYGFSDGTAETLEEMLRKTGFDGRDVLRAQLTWSEALANFLALPVVSGLLFILGIAGIYLEFKTPGFGLPGIAGIVAFALFFFGKYTVGLAEIYEILVFVTGILLIALEIFVIPGFGVPGIVGILMTILGLFLASQDFLIPDSPEEVVDLKSNLLFTSLTLTGTLVFAIALGTILPKTPIFRKLVLRPPEPARETPVPAREPSGLLGRMGVAATVLRPSGKGEFGPDLLDVVTEGEFVDAGALLEIVKVEGNRIVVHARTEKPPL